MSLNHHTRLDRAPLDTDQRPDFIGVPALLTGTYRTRDDQIISEAYPLSMEQTIASLPQSDCMWMGHDNGQREALRMHWEGRAFLTDEALDELNVTDEIRYVGYCRFNDVVTRQPPRRVNGPQNEYFVLDPSDANVKGDEFFSFELGDDENFPRVLEDLSILTAKMRELPTVSGGAHNLCVAETDNDPAGIVEVTPSSVLYDGAYLADGGFINACSGPFGRKLYPGRDARYEYYGLSISGDVTFTYQFTPSIKIAAGGETFARLTTANGNQRYWSTPHSGSLESDVHWQENFSRRLQTESVRFFTERDGVRDYLDLGAERLCINDPNTGAACDWRCDATDEAQGSRYWLREDDAQDEGCRIGESVSGVADLPPVTPTYNKGEICDRTDSNCDPIIAPLRWSVAGIDPAVGDVFVEFTLQPKFEGMMLRVSPTLTNLGDHRVGNKTQAAIEIINIGGVPIEVSDISMIEHVQSDTDFEAIPVGSAESFPLPVRGAEDGIQILPGELEFFPYALQEQEGLTIARRTLVDGDVVNIQDHEVMVNGRTLIRPSKQASLVNPAHDHGEYFVHWTSYSVRSLPFTLMPDESAKVLVNATPRGYQGINGTNEHLGWLHVEASNQFDPTESQTAEVPVVLKALNGPQLQVFPPSVSLPISGSPNPSVYRGTAVIANFGDLAMNVQSLKLGGDDDAYFSLHQPPSLPITLAPGDAQVLEIEYQQNCDPLAQLGHVAWLNVETAYQTARVRLQGTTECTLQLP